MSSNVLNEALRLSHIGFSIIWVRPNSKSPLTLNWTETPFKDEETLKKEYRDGFNIGVLTGEKTKFKDGSFLVAIDCDLKSDDPRHFKELTIALTERGFHLDRFPWVKSGRANGSMHIYARVKKLPHGGNLTTSNEFVKVKLFSNNNSKKELTELTPQEIKDGIKIRRAWEISLMSSKRQCVLPPSIHPDSGKAYEWGKEITSFEDLPLIDDLISGRYEKQETSKTEIGDFEPKKVDDKELHQKLGFKIFSLLKYGENSPKNDGSEDLFSICCSMIRAGFDHNQILTTVTDTENFISYVSQKRRKSFQSQIDWVKKYSLSRAVEKMDIKNQFPDDIETTKNNDPKNDNEQPDLDASFNEKDLWKNKFERQKGGSESGRPKNTLLNAYLIMMNAHDAKNPIQFDLFNREKRFVFDTPYGKKGELISDENVTAFIKWVSEKFRFQPSKDNAFMAFDSCARENAFHPVRDYLDALQWDRVPRVENWLSKYLNATGDKEYLKQVGTKFLCALVARIYQPGIKFDHMLMIEGSQGSGKTSAMQILGGLWFKSIFLDPNSKDTFMGLFGSWLVEIPELSGLTRHDQNHIKAFITTTHDNFRPPFERLVISCPRQCVFVGTTNDSNYLKDETGNRRYWPVSVGKTEFEALAQDRDQLFAEAKCAFYEMGYELYLTDSVVKYQAEIEQLKRTDKTEFQERIEDWLIGKLKAHEGNEFILRNKDLIFDGKEGVFDEMEKNKNAYLISTAMKRIGFLPKKIWDNDLKNMTRAWAIPRNKINQFLDQFI